MCIDERINDMNAKELFLELLKPNGNPERQLVQYEALNLFKGDPINAYLTNGRHPGMTGKDLWGVTIAWPEDHPGQQPLTTDDLKVLKDITHWRDYVKAPDVEANCQNGWEECVKAAREETGDDRLLCAFSATGLFEECHFLMGFTDTLTNLYEHPKEMHELIDYICEFKLKVVKLLCEKMHPDAIFFHDDWGAKTQLFMSPDMWREFFKEPYRKIYGYIRSQGIITIHHADSYLAPIVEDMVEIGIQCWQGVLPENNIPELQKVLNGRMILMGGIGAAIDTPDSKEEDIREYTKKVLEECCPGGHFIPSITYGLPGTIFKHVDPIIDDEINKYNSVLHLPKTETTVARRTSRISQKTENAVKETEGDIISMIQSSLMKGQKKRLVTYVNQAIENGKSASDILNNGLITGMVKLGDAFSEGKAFVPEMLMAAKCMKEATDILNPLLTNGAQTNIGKAVMGTVKGDLHDIGKSLVKIMFEGNGIEVIDLGVDVVAEDFVKTAKEQNCDIIACSSLLTTSMNEMSRVVELAKQEGIRDKVTIMVGGAPLNQEFCDRIGADIYTPDAASCARKAIEALSKKTTNKQNKAI